MPLEPGDQGDQRRLVNVTPGEVPGAIEVIQFIAKISVTRRREHLREKCDRGHGEDNDRARNGGFPWVRGADFGAGPVIHGRHTKAAKRGTQRVRTMEGSPARNGGQRLMYRNISCGIFRFIAADSFSMEQHSQIVDRDFR